MKKSNDNHIQDENTKNESNDIHVQGEKMKNESNGSLFDIKDIEVGSVEKIHLYDRIAIEVVKGLASREDYANINPQFIASYANEVATKYMDIRHDIHE